MKTIKSPYFALIACLGLIFTVGCASDRAHRRDYDYKKCSVKCDRPCCAKDGKKQCPPDCHKSYCKKK